MGRHVHRADRHEATSCWPAASRSTAWPTAGCCARGRSSDIWIQPAAGDAGGALGAALFVWHQLLDKPRTIGRPRRPEGQPARAARSRPAEIGAFLRRAGRRRISASTDERRAARARRRPAGRRQGRRLVPGPDGVRPARPRRAQHPRRSALAARCRRRMNLKIKFRESFRPFAPVVLAEHAHEWFDLRPGQESPYMLLVAPVRERAPACRSAAAAMETMRARSRPAAARERRPLHDPGRDARRLQRPRADGRRGAATRASTAC